VSGRARKQQSRAGKVRRSQPAAKKSAGPSRAATPDDPPQRQQAAGSRAGDTRPVADVRPRRPPAGSSRSGRATRYARAERRKRNQRLGVIIGAVALGGAAIGGVIAGMAGGAEPADGSSVASSSPAVSSAAAAAAGSASPAPAAPSTVTPMTLSCPTGGGATTTFGHEIVVPDPYTVTITYGDGDKYTNDSAHLGAIFSHTYKKPGTYTVEAVLTIPAGGTASATCDYTWGP
jgi:hypothetical protein